MTRANHKECELYLLCSLQGLIKRCEKMEINEQIPHLATIYYLGEDLRHTKLRVKWPTSPGIQNTDGS